MIKASIVATTDENHMSTVSLEGTPVSLLALITSMLREIADAGDMPVEMLVAGIACVLGKEEESEGMVQ